MKLVLCPECSDVFKLDFKMRKCKCGKTKGKYIDNLKAEVSKNAISIAIGNGSLEEAWHRMILIKKNTKNKATREAYIIGANITFTWVRPNSGKGNPHTKLIKK